MSPTALQLSDAFIGIIIGPANGNQFSYVVQSPASAISQWLYCIAFCYRPFLALGLSQFFTLQDFCDGHIKGARQYSSGKFGWEGHIDKLIESFSTDISLVIVHCQLSQVRAPKCARRYFLPCAHSSPTM